MTPRQYQFSWYAQDRWQVSRKLTMTLGLRYEFYPLMTRATGKGIERLIPETNQVLLGGRGNIPKAVGVTVSKRLFAPTLGLAYRLDDKTVIRTGYGINYDPLPFSRPLRGFYPLTVNFAFNALDSFSTARKLDAGIPPVFGPDLTSGVVNLPAVADMRSPYEGQIHRGYTQSWNFPVERRLPQDILGQSPMWASSVHLLADREANAGARPAAARQPSVLQQVWLYRDLMWDGYLSSTTTPPDNVRKSSARACCGAYTWSKAINMTDDNGWAGGLELGSGVRPRRSAAGYDRQRPQWLGL